MRGLTLANAMVCFREATRLDHWCAATGRPEAIVAGFFLRDPYRPLGEVRIAGRVTPHEPVAARWASVRSCVWVDGSVRLARRQELAADPPGDLVQAGPLLVRDGRSIVDEGDEEGFTAGAAQFDSDITVVVPLLRLVRRGRRLVDAETGLGRRPTPLTTGTARSRRSRT